MINLHEIKAPNDCKEALESAASQVDSMDCLVILWIAKDGSQHMQMSNCSMQEKSLLLAFFQAWATRWFGIS